MFLIVVVLLGVFFSMGYFVGRNSPASPTTDIAARPVNPIIVENPSKGSTPGSESKPPATDLSNPPVETRREPKTVEPTEKPTPLPKEKRVETRPEPRVEPAPKPSVGEPRGGGTFLQVVATSRPDSELIAETLAKKGFHTVIAPGPNPTLFRVLVGPLNGAADIAETRVRLESAGFKNPYVRKY